MNTDEIKDFKEHLDEFGPAVDGGVFIARNENGTLSMFFTDADKEKLVVMLERAKSKLVRELD